MSNVTPIRGRRFENHRALLNEIMSDDEVVGFAGFVMRRNGDMVPVVSHGMDRQTLAYGGLVLQQVSLEPDDE